MKKSDTNKTKVIVKKIGNVTFHVKEHFCDEANNQNARNYIEKSIMKDLKLLDAKDGKRNGNDVAQAYLNLCEKLKSRSITFSDGDLVLNK